MGKKPTLSDYGSSKYPRRRKKSKIKSNVLSFRCCDCQTVRYVLPRELIRAARPRCLACGGPLEETAASHERHLEKMEAVRAMRTGDRRPAQTRVKNPVCRSCGAMYPSTSSLAGHLRRNASCRQSYVRNGWYGEFQGMMVIQGTGSVVQGIPRTRGTVAFLTIDGEYGSVKARGKQGAKRVVQEIAGLQSQAAGDHSPEAT